jgi:hypothetical protein
MTESNTSPGDLIRFQLSLLELYESLLESPTWDEANINSSLKTFLSSSLAFLRLQQSLGGQVLTIQREMIRQYRAQLEQWLAEHGDVSGNGTGRPGSPAGERGRPGPSEPIA